ncbi:MAG: signal peptidase II [Thermomicrobiales bacterium]
MGRVTAANRARESLAVPFALAAVVAALDQITKSVVTRQLGQTADDHRVEIAGRFVAFEYVENSGAAFGLLRGQTVVLTMVSIAVVVVLIASYRRAQHVSWQLVVGLGLLLGGAIGNLVDRLRLGYVVDFVAISLWPKFNIADSAITIGVILIAWHAFARDRLVPSPSFAPEIGPIAPNQDMSK